MINSTPPTDVRSPAASGHYSTFNEEDSLSILDSTFDLQDSVMAVDAAATPQSSLFHPPTVTPPIDWSAFSAFSVPLDAELWSEEPVAAQDDPHQRGLDFLSHPHTSLETIPSLDSILGLDSLYWGRDSEDNPRVHYNQQGGYSHDISDALPSPEAPPPPSTSLDTIPFLPPTMSRLDSSLPLTPRRASKDDSFINYRSHEPTSPHRQPTLPPLPSTPAQNQRSFNDPQNTLRKRKRRLLDDPDMYPANAFPQATRTVSEHGGRKASKNDSAVNHSHSSVVTERRTSQDDIGINYSYAPVRNHSSSDVCPFPAAYLPCPGVLMFRPRFLTRLLSRAHRVPALPVHSPPQISPRPTIPMTSWACSSRDPRILKTPVACWLFLAVIDDLDTRFV